MWYNIFGVEMPDNLVCPLCGAVYPFGAAHTCNKPPYYVIPGLNNEDRLRVVVINDKLIEVFNDMKEALNALTLNSQAQTWAKNKLISMDNKLDDIIAALDLLNEKIP